MQEVWKDIIGYEGLYQVSNLGRVKSLQRVVKRTNGRPYTAKEKILGQFYSGRDKAGLLTGALVLFPFRVLKKTVGRESE